VGEEVRSSACGPHHRNGGDRVESFRKLLTEGVAGDNVDCLSAHQARGESSRQVWPSPLGDPLTVQCTCTCSPRTRAAGTRRSSMVPPQFYFRTPTDGTVKLPPERNVMPATTSDVSRADDAHPHGRERASPSAGAAPGTWARGVGRR